MCRIRLRYAALALALLGQLALAQISDNKTIEVIATVPTGRTPIVLKTVVHYSDLDISTSAGAIALLDRVSVTAMQVCTARQAREFPRLPTRSYERCRRDAVAVAVQRLDSPEVSRVFSSAGQ